HFAFQTVRLVEAGAVEFDFIDPDANFRIRQSDIIAISRAGDRSPQDAPGSQNQNSFLRGKRKGLGGRLGSGEQEENDYAQQMREFVLHGAGKLEVLLGHVKTTRADESA